MVQAEHIESDRIIIQRIQTIIQAHKNVNISELALDLQQAYPSVSIEQIAGIVETLEREGKIVLSEAHSVRTSFARFIFSDHPASLMCWITILVTGLSLAATYFIPHTWPFSTFRYVIGGLFALFFPGYALLQILDPRLRNRSNFESVGIAVGLSLILIIPIGLALHYIIPGFGFDFIQLCIGSLAIMLSISGAYRIFSGRREFSDSTQLTNYVISSDKANRSSSRLQVDNADDSTLRKITVGSYYLILDQIVNYGLGAAFWLVLAKLVAPSVIGQIMLVNALTVVVLGFAGYGAQVTISKYVAQYNSQKAFDASRRIFKIGLRIGLIVSGVAALFFSLFSGQLSLSIYNDGNLASLIVIAMLAVLPTQTVMSCFNGLFQGSQKMKYTAVADIIFQLSRISVAVVLVIIGLGGIGIILGFAFGSIMAAIIGYSIFVRKLVVTPHVISHQKLDLKGVAKFSGFNYLAIGMSTLGMQVSYLMLGAQTFHSVALFGISSLISGVVGGIIASLGKAVLPTASEGIENKDKTSLNTALNLTFKLSLLISGFIYIVLMIAPDNVLVLLSHEYTAAADVLRVLVLSAILTSLSGFIGSILNAQGRPNWVARIAIISSVAVIGASMIMIPSLGILGAGLAALAGSFMSLVLASYYMRREKSIHLSYESILRPVIAISSALTIGFFATIFIR